MGNRGQRETAAVAADDEHPVAPDSLRLRTGFVANGKIINLHIPQLYAIVRGKVGKTVEFGLNWGITRLGGGYLLATLACDRHELQDTKFAVRADQNHYRRS